ncbi:MAG: chromosomal replication initiator protein DnaA [Defluviitaleaceae bacterium]|nr:chromosomal replication initiator protein DnaA [Defluviitaleaceae bacterium]
MQTIWEKTKPLLENSMTQVMYDFHIETTTPISLENGVLTLMAKGDFNKNSLKTRYFHEIRNYARSASGIDDLEINIVSPEDFNNVENSQTKLSNYNYEKTNLQQKYVFETFVKGKCNELAYNAAKAVSETPESSNYNPLFLYGGVGLGKTHLVHSIGNRVLELFPELKIVYVSSETFTNELVTAIREQTTQQFKDKYRKVDILIVDDVQFLVGKDQTQEEMFHTFNELYSANEQIILTSDLPPKELTGLETRLTSRFAAGLIADVSIPDYETRTAILEKKLHSEKIEIPQTVKEFITRNIVSNIRDLEGALNKIMAYANLNNTPLTLELAQQALKDQLVNAEKPEITMEYIQQIVATHFKITTEDLNSKKRTQSIVFPRQIAMYLCRKIMDKSLPDVGKFFGGRDHSTVIHSCEKITNEMEMDEKLRILVEDLEIRIRGE